MNSLKIEKNYTFKYHEKCLRCGKPLKSKRSKMEGYGPECLKKIIKENQQKYKDKRLF